MKKQHSGRKKGNIKQVLYNLRFSIFAFLFLIVLTVAGIFILRSSLLRNAQVTGISMARNYASEEQGILSAYETLLSFGAASVDQRVQDGNTPEEISQWFGVYYDRLETVLGEGNVEAFIILDGRILTPDGNDMDAVSDIYESDWYQKTLASDGKTIFTNVFLEPDSGKPVVAASQKCRFADAMIVFEIFPETFQFHFTAADFEEGNSYFLCDGAGTLVYSYSDIDRNGAALQQYINSIISKIREGELDNYDSYIIDTDNLKRAVYFTEMENGWFSIVTIPYYNILGSLNFLILLFCLITGFSIVALVVMTWKEMGANAKIERTNETVRVLGNSYFALYRVDYGQNTYEMIKATDYVRSRIPQTGCYDDLLRVMKEVIEPETCDEYMKSFSLENIRGLVSKRVRNFGGEFLRNFNGEYRWVDVRVLFDESLAPEEVVLCFRETNEERLLQLQERRLLQDALEIARKNEQSKQSFFNNMSHDMRTPLNAIIGLSDLAGQHADDPEKVRAYLDKIGASSKQLLYLINDILDMSRMEQGMLMINPQEFDLRSCVEDCAETFRIQAEEAGKTFLEEISLKNSWVSGDPLRINQILNNLLSNALKFTDKGDTISISVNQLSEGDYGKYKFVIKDTGIGMSAEFLPHLFDPYVRETRFSSRQITGTGLGMTITKSLVVQMNGEISAKSKLGEGTVFTIILPFAAGKSAPAAAGQEAPPDKESAHDLLKGKHILLAEDNEINMEITTEILSDNDIRVTQAWNGEEAVEQFERSQLFSFDAILMDMQMPKMDGCEAARRIRALDRPDAAAVPIIAVTANAFAENIAATAAAGMDSHVSKPIDFEHLRKVLEKLMR